MLPEFWWNRETDGIHPNHLLAATVTLFQQGTAQSCDLTNFSILGDFERKMANISDFTKTPHLICLKLNQINFSPHFLLLSSH